MSKMIAVSFGFTLMMSLAACGTSVDESDAFFQRSGKSDNGCASHCVDALAAYVPPGDFTCTTSLVEFLQNPACPCLQVADLATGGGVALQRIAGENPSGTVASKRQALAPIAAAMPTATLGTVSLPGAGGVSVQTTRNQELVGAVQQAMSNAAQNVESWKTAVVSQLHTHFMEQDGTQEQDVTNTDTQSEVQDHCAEFMKARVLHRTVSAANEIVTVNLCDTPEGVIADPMFIHAPKGTAYTIHFNSVGPPINLVWASGWTGSESVNQYTFYECESVHMCSVHILPLSLDKYEISQTGGGIGVTLIAKLQSMAPWGFVHLTWQGASVGY